MWKLACNKDIQRSCPSIVPSCLPLPFLKVTMRSFLWSLHLLHDQSSLLLGNSLHFLTHPCNSHSYLFTIMTPSLASALSGIHLTHTWLLRLPSLSAAQHSLLKCLCSNTLFDFSVWIVHSNFSLKWGRLQLYLPFPKTPQS